MSYDKDSDLLLETFSLESFSSVVEEEGLKHAQTMADTVKNLFQFYNYFTSKFDVKSFSRKDENGVLYYHLVTKTDKAEETLKISGVDAKFSGNPNLESPKKITLTSYAGILMVLLVIVIAIIIIASISGGQKEEF